MSIPRYPPPDTVGDPPEPDNTTVESAERAKRISIARRSVHRKRNIKFGIECAAAIGTVVIAVLTIFYVIYSREQAEAIKGQLTAFEAVEAAALSVGDPQFNQERGSVEISIRNTGHLLAVDPEVTIYEARMHRPQDVTFENHKISPKGAEIPIAPGVSPHSVIDLPGWLAVNEVPALVQGSETILVGGKIEYGDGFGHRNAFHYCFATEYITTVKSLGWVACSPTVYEQLRDINEGRAKRVNPSN